MLKAGTSIIDISPKTGIQLAGYPHCPRPNEGVHDPLYASFLYLENGKDKLCIVTLDVLYIGKQNAKRVREKFDFPISFTATHTHSGPRLAEGTDGDEIDREYVAFFEDALIRGIEEAKENTFDALLGTGIGHAGAEVGVGGNRRTKGGICDPEVCVLAVKDMRGDIRSILVNYALHPTYLHAENVLVTADYPAYIRRFFHFAQPKAVCMFAQGASGDQSSRYHRTEQSFEEAARVGTTIGMEANRVLGEIEFSDEIPLSYKSMEIELPLKEFPPIPVLEENVRVAREKFEALKDGDYIPMRNAELFMFGAENTLHYATQIANGTFKSPELPMEIQFITIGDTLIVTVQGEIFVEYGLAVKEASPMKKTFFFETTNGALVGYVCTPEAISAGGYETGTSMLSPEAGDVILNKIQEEIKNICI